MAHVIEPIELDEPLSDAERKYNSQITLRKLLLIIVVMLLFCASLVPLYRQICEVLGVTATRAISQNTQVDTSRLVKVNFDASLNRNFAWRFEPLDREVAIHPGAIATINYRVTNTMDHPTTGRAVPSFGPVEAGLYFSKIECFCFSNQTLQPGETRDMPVTFFIDPKMPAKLEAMTLSYTFFDVTDSLKKS